MNKRDKRRNGDQVKIKRTWGKIANRPKLHV